MIGLISSPSTKEPKGRLCQLASVRHAFSMCSTLFVILLSHPSFLLSTSVPETTFQIESSLMKLKLCYHPTIQKVEKKGPFYQSEKNAMRGGVFVLTYFLNVPLIELKYCNIIKSPDFNIIALSKNWQPVH